MIVPASPKLRLNNLKNSLVACETFRRLVGTPGDAASAAEFVHLRTVEEEDGPLPRAIIGQVGSQVMTRVGGLQFEGRGKIDLVIEYHTFADADLSAWYSLTTGVPTFDDHVLHLENLYRAISDELRADLQARYAEPNRHLGDLLDSAGLTRPSWLSSE